MNDRLRATYESFIESAYWPPEKRTEARRPALERMLRHARQHVPFYSSRLDVLFTQPDRVDWTRWDEIPILTREDVLQDGRAMLSEAPPPGHGRVLSATTTGSTGAAITVHRTDYSAMMNAAVIHRLHQWHALDWRRNFLASVDSERSSDEMVQGPPWGPPWLRDSTGASYSISRLTEPGVVLAHLRAIDIQYLACRPKYAQYLALETMRRGVEIKLDAILGFSTGIVADEREDCLKAFGARMIGQYGSKEGQLMACQCPTGTHYHINEEIALVEILRDDGRACAPGEMGRVVVTSVHNFVQPMIRYDQGDLAVAGTPCSCGRTLGVIEQIVGRTTQLFRFPDGTRRFPRATRDVRRLLGADYYQIAQVGPLAIEVRYVRPAGRASQDAETVVAELVRRGTHEGAKIVVRAVDSLDRADGGKFLEYVCELGPEA